MASFPYLVSASAEPDCVKHIVQLDFPESEPCNYLNQRLQVGKFKWYPIQTVSTSRNYCILSEWLCLSQIGRVGTMKIDEIRPNIITTNLNDICIKCLTRSHPVNRNRQLCLIVHIQRALKIILSGQTPNRIRFNPTDILVKVWTSQNQF